MHDFDMRDRLYIYWRLVSGDAEVVLRPSRSSRIRARPC